MQAYRKIFRQLEQLLGCLEVRYTDRNGEGDAKDWQ